MRPNRSLLTTGVLLLALVVPAAAAGADSGGPGHGLPPESVPGSSLVADVPDPVIAGSGESIATDRTQRAVAPGVTPTSFDRLDARGWLRGDILTADLAGGTVHPRAGGRRGESWPRVVRQVAVRPHGARSALI